MISLSFIFSYHDMGVEKVAASQTPTNICQTGVNYDFSLHASLSPPVFATLTHGCSLTKASLTSALTFSDRYQSRRLWTRKAKVQTQTVSPPTWGQISFRCSLVPLRWSFCLVEKGKCHVGVNNTEFSFLLLWLCVCSSCSAVITVESL